MRAKPRKRSGVVFSIGRLQPEISAAEIDPTRRTNSSSLTTPVAGVATSFQRHSRELPSTSLEASLDELPCGKLTSTLQPGNPVRRISRHRAGG